MMKKKHLILGYRGSLNNDLITNLLQLSDSKLKEQQTEMKKKKVIINVLIECLQNILFHSGSEPNEPEVSKHCMIMIGRNEKDYYIQVGNFITSNLIQSLKSKLDHFNKLTREEVNHLYREILSKCEINENGGAGLGLLRMIRETGQTVDYDFAQVSENTSFFSMQVKVAA